MGFNWTDKQNGIDEIIAEDINAIAHEAIRLEKDKAESDLSNVSDEDFKIKAEGAGVVGAVSSVNGKTGDVELTASDVGAARNTLSNVSDDDFLAKLNAVLPDGDEVSY